MGMTIAEDFSTESATKMLAKLARDKGVPAAKLVAKFPARPGTPGEFLDMTNWIVAQSLPATEGMYRTADGQIYKVVHAVHGSGHLYAKRLDVDTRTFEIERGAVSKLSMADRMTAEDAAEFGHLYGFCVRCAATLTDEASIERGMGPVCASKI